MSPLAFHCVSHISGLGWVTVSSGSQSLRCFSLPECRVGITDCRPLPSPTSFGLGPSLCLVNVAELSSFTFLMRVSMWSSLIAPSPNLPPPLSDQPQRQTSRTPDPTVSRKRRSSTLVKCPKPQILMDAKNTLPPLPPLPLPTSSNLHQLPSSLMASQAPSSSSSPTYPDGQFTSSHHAYPTASSRTTSRTHAHSSSSHTHVLLPVNTPSGTVTYATSNTTAAAIPSGSTTRSKATGPPTLRRSHKRAQLSGATFEEIPPNDNSGSQPQVSPPAPKQSTQPHVNWKETQPFPPSKTTSSRSRSHSEAANLPLSPGESKKSPRARIASNIHSIAASFRKHSSHPSSSDLPPKSPPPPAVPPKHSILRAHTPPPSRGSQALMTTGPTTLAAPPRPTSGHLGPGSSPPRLPKKVTAIAAQVVGSQVAVGRNSALLTNSPSISAALEFMMDDKTSRRRSTASSIFASLSNNPKTRASHYPPTPEEKSMKRKSGGGSTADEKAAKRRSGGSAGLAVPDDRSTKRKSGSDTADDEKVYKRRSGPGVLQPAGGILIVDADENNTADFVTNTYSTQLPARQHAANSKTPKAIKRRSNVLGDISKAGALSADRHYNGSSSEATLKATSSPSPAQLASAYQYVNADPDNVPSMFVSRDQQPQVGSDAKKAIITPPPSRDGSQGPLPTTNASDQLSTSRSDGTTGYLPPRRSSERNKGALTVEQHTNGETSAAEFGGYRGVGDTLKRSVKGRLAAWATVHSGQRHREYGSLSIIQPSNLSTSTSPVSAGTNLTPSSPETNMGGLGGLANSSNTSIGSSQQHHEVVAKSTRNGGVPSHPRPSPGAYRSPPPAAVGFGIGGTLGAAAGGGVEAALNIGRRGWGRVERLLGHHTSASGTWSGLSGDESHRPAKQSGFMSESSVKRGQDINLGTMIRGPLRRSGMVFGRPLEDCVLETRVGAGPGSPAPSESATCVPALVMRCIEHLHRYGIEEEGIFRITGRSSHINKIRIEFDAGADYNLQEANPGELDPHAVASVFKAYLRELPESILSRSLAPLFDAVMSTNNGNTSSSFGMTSFNPDQNRVVTTTPTTPTRAPSAKTMTELKALINRLPRPNSDLLHQIVILLQHTTKNVRTTKMPLNNLLVVFCPSLHFSPIFLKLLVERQDYLFGDGPIGDVRPDNAETPEPSPVEETPATPATPAAPVPHLKIGLPSRPNADPEYGTVRRRAQVSADARRNRMTTAHALAAFVAEAAASSPRPVSPTDSSPAPVSAPSSISSGRFRTASRKPSLNLLFGNGSSGKLTTAAISAPLPHNPPNPSETPPLIQLELQDGSTSDLDQSFYTVNDGSAPPNDPVPPNSATSSERALFGGYEIVSTGDALGSPQYLQLPPNSSTPAEYSPPPQISPLNSPNRMAGEDWANSVFMLASVDQKG